MEERAGHLVVGIEHLGRKVLDIMTELGHIAAAEDRSQKFKKLDRRLRWFVEGLRVWMVLLVGACDKWDEIQTVFRIELEVLVKTLVEETHQYL